MINNIRFKIIAGKINKILEFYAIFARKMPDYIIRKRDRGQAEAKILARGLTALNMWHVFQIIWHSEAVLSKRSCAYCWVVDVYRSRGV